MVDLQGESIDGAAAKRLLPNVLGQGAARFIEAVAEPEDPSVTLPELRAYPDRKLVEDRFPDPALLEGLRESYDRSEVVAVRVPVMLFPKEHEPAQGHVDVLLLRADGDQSAVHLWLRDDLTVPSGGLFRAEGAHSALMARPGSVARFLADAEPPAHDVWTTTTKLKDNWKYAQATLTLIRTAPARLHELLTVGAEKKLPDELLEFFWFEDSTGVGKDGRTGRKAKRSPGTPIDLPPPRQRQLAISQETGGFAVRAGSGLTPDLLPCRVRIRVAYDLEDADPFRAWSLYDFDLGDPNGDIEVEREGCTLVRRLNEIEAEVTEPNFSVRVHGFDPNRDLEVRANRLRGSAS